MTDPDHKAQTEGSSLRRAVGRTSSRPTAVRQTLPVLLDWFRETWQAEMGTGAIHVHATDGGGDPDWTKRFRDMMRYPEDPNQNVAGEDLARMRSFPMRWHLRSMARTGRWGEARARFLFVLACQAFSVRDTARIISRAGDDDHGEQWALDYAHASLRQLWGRMHDPARTHEGGHPRSFVERRIAKSEAQARAEEAGHQA